MSEELTAQNKIKILSVGFPFGYPDDAGMSVFYGPHECTALFVSGITSSIGKKECIALQKAIASTFNRKENVRSEELKPCPACENKDIEIISDETGATTFCTDCGMFGPYGADRYRAIDKWNDLPRRLEITPKDAD